MQHNGGRGARRGPQSPAPTRRGDCWHECGGPLEAQDERAAGWPGAHAGAQDAASSSWTPGSSGLLTPSPQPSFLFRGDKGWRDLRGQNTRSGKILSRALTGIRTHQFSNPPHPLPQACHTHRAPCWSSRPQVSACDSPGLPTQPGFWSPSLSDSTDSPTSSSTSRAFHVGLHQPPQS